MKWSFLNVPLGLTDPARSKRAGWEEALIGMAAGSFTSFLDSQNIENTNAANERNVFNTNEANKEINAQQIAWAREKYEQEKAENRFLVDQAYQRELENRAYNSPKSLKQRYIDAGINPYLAMYGGSGGSVGSIGSSVGSPPKYDNPSMIPMQSGAPMQSFTGFGRGINDILATALAFSADERENYRLASDITFRDYEARNRHLEYLLHKSSNESEAKWYKAQIEDLDRKWSLEKDKLQRLVDWDNFQREVINYQTQQRDFELHLQEQATKSGIALNAQQASTLFAQQNLFKREASEMLKNGVEQRNLLRTQERKEDQMVDLLIQDYKETEGQLSFENESKLRRAYKRVANWVLNPVSHVLSVGANVSTKVK